MSVGAEEATQQTLTVASPLPGVVLPLSEVPDPVFAQGAADRPTRFIRVMILPRALQGKSSIQYVNEDDRAKPKSQSYKIYADAPITFEGKK